MSAHRQLARRAAALLALATPAVAAEGAIPSRAFDPSEQWTIISPQMSDRHMNQPSVFNGYAILAGNAVHEVWDISDPYLPAFRAEMVSDHAAGEAESHQVAYGRDAAGKYYLATTSGRGVDLWNLSDTTQPVLEAGLMLEGINYGDVAGAVWGLAWQGGYLFVGATTNGVYVVDVSDPAAPRHVATVSRAELGGVVAGPLFALGDLLVVTSPKGSSGVATVDISTPEDPALLDSLDPPADSYIGGFHGRNAYLITPFRAYDVTTDPRNIAELSSVPVPASEYHSYSGHHLFLGGLRGGTEGIHKYDISDPANPVLEGRVVGRDSRWDDQFSCCVGNLLLIADDQRVDDQYVGAVIAVHDTVPDTTPLEVVQVYPADGAVDQSTSGQVAVSFSKWPEFASVDPASFVLRPVGGTALAGSWGCGASVLSFASEAPLEPLTEYELVLPAGGITDLVGNPLAATVISTFTTGSGEGSGGGEEVVAPDPVELGGVSEFSIANPAPNRIYHWDFGDGSGAEGATVSHTYASAGRHQVLVEASEATVQQFEAEDPAHATLEGGVVVASNNAGYTGTGFADFPATSGPGVRLTFTVELAAAATVDLEFRYALSEGARPLNLVVNGGAATNLDFTSSGSWTSWETLAVPGVALEAGSNTIALVADAGSVGPNIDQLALQLADAGESTSLASFVHLVHRPLTAMPPASSQPLVQAAGRIWVVNPDAASVSAVDPVTLARGDELAVGAHPCALAEAPDGRLWVVCRDSWEIQRIDPAGGVLVDSLPLPFASQPSGIVFAPDGSAAFVTLQALGRLLKLDPATGAVVASLDLGPDARGIVPELRGLAVSAASDAVYVPRFISPDSAGEVFVVDPASMTPIDPIALEKSEGSDGSSFARGLPNYLASITISPDGARAWVPSKKDNIDRGGFRDGQELDHDVTVRAITSTIDLATGSHLVGERIDFDDSDRCHSVTFSPLGDLVFATLPGNERVVVVDAYSGAIVSELPTAAVPEGALLDSVTGRLFVLNFLSRSLSVIDVSEILAGGVVADDLGEVSLVDVEPLAPEVLHGKRLFHDARSKRLNLAGYMSCASCHLDGGGDGRVWDFSAPMGEGLRNTIDLRGRAGTGHGRVHWSGNFDEIHDFEGQIRLLGKGSGLMEDAGFDAGTRAQALGDPKSGVSADLDAMAAYLGSLVDFPPSPHRNPDGSLSADGVAGRAIFTGLNCHSCHGGEAFTDSLLGVLHDVGTLTADSGQRLGEPLDGLDTPTLRGVWATAPYLHDGSAATLEEVLTTANPADPHGMTSNLGPAELDQLVAYLKQIDGLEPPAPAFTGVGTVTFASFVADAGLAGADATAEADPDHDGWPSIAEFCLGGTDPDDAGDHPGGSLGSLALGTIDGHFHHAWLRLSGGVWEGTRYRRGGVLWDPQASLAPMVDWNEAVWIVPNPAGLPPAPDGYEWATGIMAAPMSAAGRGFMRLEIVAE